MIFHIGLNKTGSTSLYRALKILGYKSSHGSEAIKRQINANIANNLHPLNAIDSELEAITDNNAVNQNFEYIHRYYPNAYYIYTPRDTKSWLDSREQHVIDNQQNPKYEGGWLTVDRQQWKDDKRRHEIRIAHWIHENKPNYLPLPICSDRDDKWELLCNFLDKPIPNKPFPHKNKS